MPTRRPTSPASVGTQTPAPRPRPAAQPAPGGHVRLGPGWYAWLAFGTDDSPDAYRRITRLLAEDFGGAVTATPSRDEETEFSEVRVGAARFLLVRRAGAGVSLGADRADLPVLLRIATAYGAKPVGWRWHLYRVLSRIGMA
jgi:hypothetical protein